MKKVLSIALSLLFLITLPATAYAAESRTPTGIPLSEIESRIDELVVTYMHEFTPGLAVAVVYNGEIVFSRGYGYADITQQIPVDPAATVFEYGSITKVFVYVAVMQLVEQGLLDLDADIHNYLPEDLAQQFNFRYSFTMRDLLNHSAGFGGFHFNVGQDADNVAIRRTLREALLATQPPQIFEPGTATGYANFSSALAAYIVTYISGQDFSVFERTNILNPLGMNNTRQQPDWFGDSAFMQSHARGHQPNTNGGFSEAPLTYLSVYPAGSLRGTVEDLAKFAIAFLPSDGEASPLFNSRDTLDLMLSPSYINPIILRGTHHGLFSYDGIYPTIGHSGGTIGFGSQFAIVPSHGFGVVILSNARGANVFNDKILDMLVGNTRDLVPPSPQNLPNAENVAGTYVSLMRSEGNIYESLNIMLGTHIVVAAIDENTITLTQDGITIIYRQIEPYVFRAVYAETPSARNRARTMYEIYFRMENGRAIGISSSYINDATLQTFGQGMLVSMGSMAITVICIIFFLVMSVIALIGLLRRKGKESNVFTHLSNGLLCCGLLFTVNYIVLLARFLSVSAFIQSHMVTPHIWINYILLIISASIVAVSFVFIKKEAVATKRKILHFSTATLLGLFVISLWYWNYFVMM